MTTPLTLRAGPWWAVIVVMGASLSGCPGQKAGPTAQPEPSTSQIGSRAAPLPSDSNPATAAPPSALTASAAPSSATSAALERCLFAPPKGTWTPLGGAVTPNHYVTVAFRECGEQPSSAGWTYVSGPQDRSASGPRELAVSVHRCGEDLPAAAAPARLAALGQFEDSTKLTPEGALLTELPSDGTLFFWYRRGPWLVEAVDKNWVTGHPPRDFRPVFASWATELFERCLVGAP